MLTTVLDAIKGAALLDIVQTRRQVKDSKLDIPMCGVPVHALDNYLERLIKKGQMVAVCDQVEAVSEAKKRRERVKRDITRLYVGNVNCNAIKKLIFLNILRVTPGTLTEDEFLDARRSNYLASIFRHPKTGDIGLAWLELSTGDFNMAPASCS
jgi:DNA mismatch repair protein MutS